MEIVDDDNNKNDNDNIQSHEKLSGDYLHSGNLIYSLWNFGDVVILIRCKAHGFIQELDSDHKVHSIKIIIVFSS